MTGQVVDGFGGVGPIVYILVSEFYSESEAKEYVWSEMLKGNNVKLVATEFCWTVESTQQ